MVILFIMLPGYVKLSVQAMASDQQSEKLHNLTGMFGVFTVLFSLFVSLHRV
jgi:hypothetical protein